MQLERHFQTVLLAVIVGLIGWAGLSIQSQGADIVRLQEQVTSLNLRIDANMDDRYRKQDARDDFALRDKLYYDLEARVRALESK